MITVFLNIRIDYSMMHHICREKISILERPSSFLFISYVGNTVGF